MAADFTDIRIVGLDEGRTTRSSPAESFYDVHFVLSAEAPIGWCHVLQARLGPRGVAGRRAWPQGTYVVVRCAIDEVERVLGALGPVLETANREFRARLAADDRARLAGEAFDRQEGQKLRDVKARLGFD